MFDNSILNVVIGLVFIFLIYSLFATALQEAFASVFQSRAATLYKGITSMLTNTYLTQSVFERIWNYIKSLVTGIWRWIKSWFVDSKVETLYDKFYHHPIIKNYGENAIFSKPSYLTAENFSTILIDTIKNLNPANLVKTADFQMISDTLINYADMPAGLATNFPDRVAVSPPSIDCETFLILNFHLNEAAGDLNVFKSRLEQWFNDTMARVSGWYKRHTQMWLFIIGFGLAMTLNINTIKIVGQLSKNKELAGKLADMGTAVASNSHFKDSIITTSILTEVKHQKDTVNTLLGLGWPYKGSTKIGCEVKYVLTQTFCKSLTDFFGLFITAIAISLGAPFWFDLLSKFINLRSAGKTVNPSGSSTNNNVAGGGGGG